MQGEISYRLSLFYVKFILAHRICPNPSVGGTGTGVCPRQVLNGGSVGGSVPGELLVSDDAPPGDARSRLSEFAMPPVRDVVVGYPAFRVRLSGLRKSAIRFAQAGYPVRASRISGSRAVQCAFT